MSARRIVQLKQGEPEEVLQLQLLQEEAPPRARPGCVLVRITLRPINPTDLILLRHGGRHLNPPTCPFPRSVGSEGFGIVHQVGEGVTRFHCGQRVVPLAKLEYQHHGQGTWQDFVELEEDQVIAVPASVSDEAAAQYFVNPWTAYGLLDDQAVPKGEYLLQTAAASALGRQLIQLAKHWGIKTINIVRRDTWKEELKALGADEVINSETEDIVQRVKEITGGKLAYGAMDAVGGVLTKTVAAAVRDGGKVMVYGLLSGWDVTVSAADLMRGVQVSWWWLLPDYIPTPEKRAYVAAKVMQLFEQHILTPLTCEKYPIEEFLAAIRESEKPNHPGKVLLVS